MSKGQKNMAYCTPKQVISSWLATLTVIGQEVLMIERTCHDMYFTWVQKPFHGLPRSSE